MDISIEHEVPGRIRFKLAGPVPASDIDALEKVLLSCSRIESVRIYPRIGSLAVSYLGGVSQREAVMSHVRSVDAESIEQARTTFCAAAVPRTHELMMDLALIATAHFAKHWLLPRPLSFFVCLWQYRRFVVHALQSLRARRLDVPVLDAAAIGISFAKGDPATAGETMLLLKVGETLEEYTRARSEHELIYSLLEAPEQAQLVHGDTEQAVPASSLRDGDLIVVRTGMPICVDGEVERGTAMVNQSTLTGEPLAVERTCGDTVFAGTAVEDGEIFVRVKATAGDSKLRSIVSLVELSESCKAEAQSKRERLADRIVPWNFLLAGVVALSTRSLVKTSAALMVDYSCALKLTGSIAVLSAMSQSAKMGFTVKGSKHFENIAAADTIVFDKTGTMTEATPEVANIIAFAGWNRGQVLRFAACLEEHFPHPVARAVVRAAEAKHLKHRERHAAVEYIVAHGIASTLEGKRAVIGSRHFVVEDEHVVISPDHDERIRIEMDGLSVLYLAVDGNLVGVLGVHDPLKADAAMAVEQLRRQGFKRMVMLTGDNEATAARVAEAAGISEYQANLLPEDKFRIIQQLKAEGCRVIMVGDGVNDSPALSAADVGVAMGQGTAIAKEVADVTLSEGDLFSLVRLRRLSCELMRRLDMSFIQVVAVNSALLAGGVLGLITPQASSLMHNATTVAFSLGCGKAYPEEG